MNTQFDIYQLVTDRIIKQLDNGIIPWHKPWKMVGVQLKNADDMTKVAFNRVTKTAYSPLNQMLLSKAGEYATFFQWKALGGTIKKGAKSEIIVFWKMQERIEKVEDENGEEKEERILKPILKYYNVFHIDDVDGVEPLKGEELPTSPTFDTEEQAEQIIDTYKEREQIQICFGGDSAYYSSMLDKIQIPYKEQFKQKAEYYSTIFHEMTHSTGAKNRLDRLSNGAFFGNVDYSKEELVAEIGASGLCSILNIETETSFRNTTAYIQNWLEVLKNDKKLIVSASSKAEKAVYYILNGKEKNTEAVA